MKSWIILIVAAVAITALATVAVPFLAVDTSVAGPGIPAPTATPDGPTPTVEVGSDLAYKFGVMAQETEGKHGWIFKNTGLGTLELRNLGTDCSCTVAQIGDPGKPGVDQPTMLPVKPGSSEPIELTWNTRKLDGAYRKTARIGTNDPNRPEITLAVEGEVYPAITLYPPDSTVDFLTVGNEEEHTRQVALYSKDKPDIKITRLVSWDPAMLGVDCRPLNDEEKKVLKVDAGYSLQFKLKKTDHLGAFAGEVLVETDHPKKSQLKVTIRGKISGPVAFIPEKLILRDVNSSFGGSKDVKIWVRGQTSASFTVAKKPEGIDVAIVPVPAASGSKGSSYMMTVRVVPGTPAGLIDGDLVLKTDVPTAGEVRLPLDILVQSSN